LPEWRKIEEIWVELSLELISLFKSQAVWVSRGGMPLNTGDFHITTFRMRRVERYTKKPYTLEKIGIAVKKELEK